ncbi:MAG TPA: response regulator transcription factor [Ferruginibacter sp.]|jgi:DNA-binding NarL/FixJ family response regulator|nr:response regulator transcription factor [Bacteroidota bacterium]MBS1925193.1 response regulator transcription factor [Bacteroidota bacterium]HMT96932.1 response regulator transcription factor [Ferruginibacter sp.]HMU25520.1 response regulator transcription factor [Ferruginibacter sp.]
MKQENSDPIQVIIADDHVLFRAGVKTALSSKKDVKFIAEADNGMHLLTLLKAVVPDVILLDIEMPIMTGINVLPEIKKLYPNVKIIMLTMLNDHSMVTQLMELGANSYLTKDSDSEVIYEAIKTCVEQEYFFNDITNKALLTNLKEKHNVVPQHLAAAEVVLNEKETTILRLMCEEKSTKEIADIVDLSPRTVESIRDKLKVKTGAKSTAGLIMYAVKHKIIEEM